MKTARVADLWLAGIESLLLFARIQMTYHVKIIIFRFFQSSKTGKSMDKVQETRSRYNSQEYPHHQSCPSKNDNHKIQILKLLLASFLVLYFELVIIRYLSTEIRIFAYMKNLPLIASFFGIGLGMVRRSPPKVLWRLFPFIAFLLFFQISFAPLLNLTHTPFPAKDYYVYGTKNISGMKDALDRKSTRLNSSHSQISYAVFCLKKN